MNKLNLNKFEWIFFDIGGVLITESPSTNELKRQTIFSILKEYFPSIKIEDIQNVWPEASSTIGTLHLNAIKLLLKDRKDLLSEVNEKYDIEVKNWPPYKERNSILPEVKEVVSKLSKNFKIGIIANQPSMVREILKEAGIIEYFSILGISEEYKLFKPDPEFFKRVLKNCGTDSIKSVFIDDNVDRGLLPAKQLGFTTIWLNSDKKENSSGGFDFEINSLRELIN